MTEGDSSGSNMVAVARCSNCGYIYGDDLDYRFPNPSQCEICGEETETTTLAAEDTVDTLTDGGVRADGGSVTNRTIGFGHVDEANVTVDDGGPELARFVLVNEQGEKLLFQMSQDKARALAANLPQPAQ